MLIGAITIVSNIVGFGRQLVFAHTVSATCLGTAYATANQVPNIIYDIVLGGALTSVLIPVLAGPAARRLGQAPATGPARPAASSRPGARRHATVPRPGQPDRLRDAVLGGPAARPGQRDHRRGGDPAGLAAARQAHRAARTAAIVAVSSRMLVVFAPQILLYGLAVVLYGILQAHRRFTAPALAPVLSSLVVISAYLAFVPLSQGYRPAGRAAPVGRADAVRGHHGGRGRAGPHRAGPGAAAAAAAAAHAAFPGGRGARGSAAWPRWG